VTTVILVLKTSVILQKVVNSLPSQNLGSPTNVKKLFVELLGGQKFLTLMLVMMVILAQKILVILLLVAFSHKYLSLHSTNAKRPNVLLMDGK